MPDSSAQEIELLRVRLREAEDTLHAIQHGEIDALLISNVQGSQIFTLQGSEYPYRAMVEAMQEGAVTLSVDGDILYCNPRFAELLKIPMNRLMGTPMRSWVLADHHELLDNLLLQARQLPTHGELLLHSSTGDEIPVSSDAIPVSIALSSFPLQETSAICLVVTDLRELRRREAESRLLQNLQVAISEADSPNAALDGVLKQILSRTQWEMGEAWKLTEVGQQLTLASTRSAPGAELKVFADATDQYVPQPGSGLIGKAWASKEPVWIRDVTEDDDFLRTVPALAAGLKAAVAIPVLADGDLVAVLAFFMLESREIDDDFIRMMTTAASHIGTFIQRKQGEESIERLAAIVETSTDAIIGTTLDAVISSWNTGAERIYGYTRSEVIGQKSSILAPDDRKDETGILHDHISRGLPVAHFETVRQTKDGRLIDVNLSVSPIFTVEKQLFGASTIAQDITERKAAERALQDNEERFRTLVQNSTDIITILAADGTILYETPSLERVLGYRQEDIRGLDSKVIHPDDLPMFLGQLAIILDQPETPLSLEVRFQHTDGSWRTLEMMLTNLLDHPAVRGIVANSRDITERRRSDDAIRFQAQLLDTVGQAVIAADAKNRIIYWNRFAETLYGWPAEEALGHNLVELIPADSMVERGVEIMAGLRAGETWSGEFITRRRDGSLFPSWVTDSPIFDDQGTLVGVIGVSMDITERKQAEVEEREHRVLAEALRDTAAALISTSDVKTVMTRVLELVSRVVPYDYASISMIEGDSSVAVYALGWSEQDEAIVKSIRRPLHTRYLHEMITTRQPFVIADLAAEPDWSGPNRKIHALPRAYVGAPIQIYGQVVGFLNLTSNTVGFFTTQHAERLRDFANQAAIAIETAQLYDEIQHHALALEARVNERTAALERAKERVEAILDNSSDAIIVTRKDGTISQANPAFSQLFDYGPDEAVNQPLFLLAGPMDVDALLEAMQGVLDSNQPCRIEISMRRKDGKAFDADVMLSSINARNASSADALSATGLVCGVRDNTERKQAEIVMRQTLKAEQELGELKSRFVSMVSHEFRTPLSTIQISTDLIKRYRARMTDEQEAQHLDKIQREVRQLTDLLDDTLIISQSDMVGLTLKSVSADLVAFCHQIRDGFQTITPEHQILFVTEEKICTAEIDLKLLGQAISNLLSNAAKYSPPDAMIWMELKCEADFATISVRDQGIGIPEQDQSHLFDNFFRAQNVGTRPGTGLGLAIVKRAIEAHHGTVKVESREGVGSSFALRLPILQPQA